MSILEDKLAENSQSDKYNDAALVDNSLYYLLGGFGTNKIANAIKTAINRANKAKIINEIWDKRKYWGVPFREGSNNPDKAVEILKDKQQGFVPNADGNGVDFVWGEYIPPTKLGEKGKGYGLAHIEGRRNEQGYNGKEFLDNIPYLFNVGKKYTKPQHNGRYYIGDGEIEGIIRTDYDGKPWDWLNSMYYLE